MFMSTDEDAISQAHAAQLAAAIHAPKHVTAADGDVGAVFH